MSNIIIFGGAFDPIHSGHIKIAEKASLKFNADVYFVPAKIAVWKNDSIPARNKLDMIKLSIQGRKRLYIDDFELKTDKEVNYSIDTVKYFKEKYPNDNLYLLIGLDQVAEFHRWKDAKEISRLAQIIYYERNVDASKDKIENNIKEFNMLKIEGEIFDAASTDIKNLKSIDVPFSVIKYIEDHELYYVNKIRRMIRSNNRYLHSLSVAHLAYDIAVSNKLPNPYDAYIAGLIHDIGKNYPEEKRIMEEVFPEYLNESEPVYHQFVGAYLAEKVLGCKNKTILNAVKFHTTGSPDFDEIGKIVYCADKIEPTRGYDSSEMISRMMANLEEGFVFVLRENKNYFEQHKVEIKKDSLTQKTFDKYLNK